MECKLEVVMIPVTDIDRSVDFYTNKLGFNLDVDHERDEEFRVVQVTPSGSACSIVFGRGITDARPGTSKGVHLVVTDIEAAVAELVEQGVACSEVRHMENGEWRSGTEPERRDYNSFSEFIDPDGNSFVIQEVGYRHDRTETG